MVLPWFAMSLEFYANIPGMPEGSTLVIDKATLGLILGGTIISWRSPMLITANPWIGALNASEADMAIKVCPPDFKMTTVGCSLNAHVTLPPCRNSDS